MAVVGGQGSSLGIGGGSSLRGHVQSGGMEAWSPEMLAEFAEFNVASPTIGKFGVIILRLVQASLLRNILSEQSVM